MTAAAPAAPFARYRDEFPIFRHARYLNTCSLGAVSTRTRAAMTEYLDLWERRGAAAWYDTWLPMVERLRGAYARIIGATAQDVAIHPSISSALSVVAECLEYRVRPKVVTTSLDFPTVAYQWLAKAARGVEVVVVESPDGITVPLELLATAVDERTAVLATSHVFFTSGAIQDLRALAAVTRANGALLLVDGYHATGQIPVEVTDLGVDFYCSGGLKWLLGGSGIAFLYVRPELQPRLEPGVTGWFAHAAPFRFDPRSLERAADAHRFEMGTPGIAGVYAQLAGLSIIEEIGVMAIRAATAQLTDDLIAVAAAHGLRPRVAVDPAVRSGIVMLPRQDPQADVRRLAAEGFIVDARPGHVRVSPYFYNIPDDHRQLVEHLVRE
jgi:selenocysteine lyase/cysteine desulfurase